MAAYIVVEVTVNDPELYEQYKTLVPASIAAHGGSYLARGGAVRTLEGDWSPSRFVIVEFPTVEQAQTWWDSADYAAAKTLRHKAATTQMLLVEGIQ